MVMIHGDKANIAVSLSSAEAPRWWGRWIGKKKKVRLGQREDGVPRALSFTLSPASKLPTWPSAKEASAEERVAVC